MYIQFQITKNDKNNFIKDNVKLKFKHFLLLLLFFLVFNLTSCVIAYKSGTFTITKLRNDTIPNFKKYISYSGTFSPDGTKFFFTSNPDNSIKSNFRNYDSTVSHDIWFVNVLSKNENEIVFDTPKNMNEIMESEGVKTINKINSQLNEGSPSFSYDGKFMYFSACNRPKGKGGCDIFVSEFINGKWTEPFNIDNYLTNKLDTNINTGAFESLPFISKDNKKLLFVSTRYTSKYSDGIDNSKNYNIWESNYDEINKIWKNAEIIENINSEFSDTAPYLSNNGDTLYFSTSRFTNGKSLDLVYSIFDKTANKWSKPKLFEKYNTEFDDMLFAKSPDDKYIIINTRENDLSKYKNILFNSALHWNNFKDTTIIDDMKIIILKNK